MNGIKRLAVGVILLGIFMFFGSYNAYAQFGLGQPPIQQNVEPKCLSAAGGRFVFGQISDSDKDKFMLDTLTGRLWQVAESGDVGLFLREVPYRIGTEAYAPLPGSPPETEREKAPKK